MTFSQWSRFATVAWPKIDTMDEAAALSRMSELQAQGFTPVSVKGNNSHVYAQAG